MKDIPISVALPILAVFTLAAGLVGWKLGLESAAFQKNVTAAPPISASSKMAPMDEVAGDDVAPVPLAGPRAPVAAASPESSSDRDFDFQAMLAELDAMNMRIIPEDFVSRLGISVISENGSPVLTDEVIELFSLGDAEVAQLNAALTRAAETLTAAEMEGVEVIEVSDSEVAIELPDLGPVGEQVEETLRQEVLSTLGATDGGLFYDLMKYRNGRYWSSYGRAGRRYAFSAEPTEGGAVLLRIQEFWPRNESGEFVIYRTKHSSLEPGETGQDFGLIGQREDYVRDLLPDPLRRYFSPPEESR